MLNMLNPDLGDQLSHVLASLEKATPQVLELATRTMRFDACVTGGVELLVLAFCISAALWLWRWLPRDAARDEQAADEVRILACIAIAGFGVATLFLLCQLPDQASKFVNARYWAVADLLARVKPGR